MAKSNGLSTTGYAAIFFGETSYKCWRRRFYEYQDGVYVERDDDAVKQRIVQWSRKEDFFPSSAALDAMIDWAKASLYLDSRLVPPFRIDTMKPAKNLLVLNNGILDLEPLLVGEDPKLLPFSEMLFATAKADYAYKPGDEPEKFDEFMKWFTCGDQEVSSLLLQYLAYGLLSDLQYQKFMILVGNGRNGKSVFLHVARRLFGAGNTAAVPLDLLANRFAKADLVGKRMNIVADLSELDKVEEGWLKMLTDGSAVPVERKYQEAYLTQLDCRLLFSCNQLPFFRDRSQGMERRLIVVSCEATPDKEAPRYEDELCKELPGILNRVIAAAKDLDAAKGFRIPTKCQQAVNDHRRDTSSASSFFKRHLREGLSDDWITTEKLYGYYTTFCKNWGFRQPLTRPNFGKELVAEFSTAERVRESSGRRRWGYVGLEFNQEGDSFEDGGSDRHGERQEPVVTSATKEQVEQAKKSAEEARQTLVAVKKWAADAAESVDAAKYHANTVKGQMAVAKKQRRLVAEFFDAAFGSLDQGKSLIARLIRDVNANGFGHLLGALDEFQKVSPDNQAVRRDCEQIKKQLITARENALNKGKKNQAVQRTEEDLAIARELDALAGGHDPTEPAGVEKPPESDPVEIAEVDEYLSAPKPESFPEGIKKEIADIERALRGESSPDSTAVEETKQTDGETTSSSIPPTLEPGDPGASQ